jgi:putative ABC transport system permease protein
MRVAGLVDEFNDFGGNTIRMSIASADRIYGVRTPSRLAVVAASPDRRTALAREVDRLLGRRYPQVEALSTAELKHDVEGQINQSFALFNAILAIAILVSLLGVVNTLAMSVVERTREIGVLRALGTTRWLVRLTMVHEGVLITLAGAVAGIGLGALIAFFWVRSLTSLLPHIAFALPATLIVGVAVAAVALGTIAAALPARRAARLDVVDALAYE